MDADQKMAIYDEVDGAFRDVLKQIRLKYQHDPESYNWAFRMYVPILCTLIYALSLQQDTAANEQTIECLRMAADRIAKEEQGRKH